MDEITSMAEARSIPTADLPPEAQDDGERVIATGPDDLTYARYRDRFLDRDLERMRAGGEVAAGWAVLRYAQWQRQNGQPVDPRIVDAVLAGIAEALDAHDTSAALYRASAPSSGVEKPKIDLALHLGLTRSIRDDQGRRHRKMGRFDRAGEFGLEVAQDAFPRLMQGGSWATATSSLEADDRVSFEGERLSVGAALLSAGTLYSSDRWSDVVYEEVAKEHGIGLNPARRMIEQHRHALNVQLGQEVWGRYQIELARLQRESASPPEKRLERRARNRAIAAISDATGYDDGRVRFALNAFSSASSPRLEADGSPSPRRGGKQGRSVSQLAGWQNLAAAWGMPPASP